MCVYFVALMCSGRFRLSWTHDFFFWFACHMFMHFHVYVPSFLYIPIYWCVWCFSLCVCLFLSFFHLVASWNLNENLFRPRILFVLWHPLLPLIPLLLLFDSVMRRPVRTSWRTSLDEAFIQNAKSSYQIFPILTYPLSSTVGVGSHCLASRSRALPWSYRCFTPICMNLITLYPSLSLVFGVYAL